MDTLHIVCPRCLAVNRIPGNRRADHPRCGKCKAPLFMGRSVKLDESSFERHLRRNDVPVAVDFWAPWCGPCQLMAPAYEEAAAQLEPDVRLAKVNTEEMPQLAAQYEIRGIPTIILFKTGQEIDRRIGAVNLQQLVQWIRPHLS